jgi:hypothetical protein
MAWRRMSLGRKIRTREKEAVIYYAKTSSVGEI